jgi:hypothetical protein
MSPIGTQKSAIKYLINRVNIYPITKEAKKKRK